MIQITFVILSILFSMAIVWFYYQFNLLEMKKFKAQLLAKINELPEEALDRRMRFSKTILRPREVKKNPELLDRLCWEDLFFYQEKNKYLKSGFKKQQFT
jgi:hypothetical protein